MTNVTVAQVIIGIGLSFDLFGAIGLMRLPDVYNRVQAATKCVTLGTVMILVGVAVWCFPTNAALAVKALMCAVFILLTSPVAAHAIARGAHRSGVRLWQGSVVDRYLEDRGGAGAGRTGLTSTESEGAEKYAQTQAAGVAGGGESGRQGTVHGEVPR
jgi:multicomponent Na+:H+ antiporter subunit G